MANCIDAASDLHSGGEPHGALPSAFRACSATSASVLGGRAGRRWPSGVDPHGHPQAARTTSVRRVARRLAEKVLRRTPKLAVLMRSAGMRT